MRIPPSIRVFAAFLAVLAVSATAQDAETTKKAKDAAETLFKNPQLQEIITSVKENPDAAMKNVSNIAREQLGKVQGTQSNGVPATRAQVPATPPASTLPKVNAPTQAPATPSTATPAVPAAATTPQSMIPEPVARGTRPEAPPAPAGLPPATPQPPQAGTVPPPRPLTPRYDKSGSNSATKSNKGKSNAEMMEITADESVMDDASNILTFTGHVVVQSPDFNLSSDKLVIYMNDDAAPDGTPAPETDAPFKRAIATGGMVEIERIGEKGEVQIAKARNADYNAVTKDIVLTGGPPTLQSGKALVNPNSPDATIILKGNGQHIVKGGRSTFSVPMKGGAMKQTLPGGSLEDFSNRGGN